MRKGNREVVSQEPFITVRIPLSLLQEKAIQNFLDYLECVEILEKADPDREAFETLLREIETRRHQRVKKVLTCVL